MSRSTYRQIAGAVLAIGALVLGLTAAAAIGWGGETQGTSQDHGQKDHGRQGSKEESGSKKESGGNQDYGNKKPPTETIPPRTVNTPPVTETSPPVVVTTPPSTVTVQSPPAVTTKTTTTKSPPVTTTTTTPGPPTETTPPPKTPPLTPVAERKRLASTGLSPWLIALFGAALLGGGSFLFRRALARD
jgi:hypothetical protein